MKQLFLPTIFCLLLSTQVSAQSPSSVDKGVEIYDWDACLDTMSNPCINECATSEDTDCKDNCLTLARDKCISKGLTPTSHFNED